MLDLSVQTPPAPLPGSPDVVERAIETSGTASGGHAGSDCAFHSLGEAASALLSTLRPAGASGGDWVLVTVREADGVAHQAHLHERSRTAAQRFMLALACDGVDSRWVAEAPGAESLRAVGVDLPGRSPVGLVWYAGL